jgi:hypothetical protein
MITTKFQFICIVWYFSYPLFFIAGSKLNESERWKGVDSAICVLAMKINQLKLNLQIFKFMFDYLKCS